MNTNPKYKMLMLSVLVAILFITLAVIQLVLFDKAQEANNKIFRGRVSFVAKNVSEYLQSTIAPSQLDSVYYSKNDKDKKALNRYFQKHIDSVLQSNSLELEHQFAVFPYSENGPVPTDFFLGNIKNKISLENECENAVSGKLDYVTWCLMDSKAKPTIKYSLLIYFPKKSEYLLEQISGIFISNFLIIIVLLVSFIYFLRIIARQKKVSAIKNDFINNLTHEFKTPLFSIGLASKFLKNDQHIPQDSEARKFITIIDNENNRLKNQVDKILQVALIDSDNFRIEKKIIDVHKIIEEVAKSFELAIKEKNGVLQLHLNATDSLVSGDELHLKNMFFNLVDNAFKYSKEVLAITITTDNQLVVKNQKKYHQFVISIADQGIGMDENVIKNIFERFYRAETGNIHTIKGFGLGLSYVKSILERHKGTISISSKPNEGSTFTIVLPQKEA